MHVAPSPPIPSAARAISGRLELTRVEVLKLARREARDRRRLANVPRTVERAAFLAASITTAATIAAALDAMPAALRAAYRRDVLPVLSARRTVQASTSIRCDVPDRRQFSIAWADALDCPWLAPNEAGTWRALAFDADLGDALDLAAALPPHVRPWIILDPYTLRAHVVWFLRVPVIEARANRRTLALLHRMRRLAACYFRAAPMDCAALVKNPAGLACHLAGPLMHRRGATACASTWEAWCASASPLCWWTVPGAGAATLYEIADALDPLAGDEADALAIREAEAAGFDAGKAAHMRTRRAASDDDTGGGYLFDRLVAAYCRSPSADLAEHERRALDMLPTSADAGMKHREAMAAAKRAHRYCLRYMARLGARPTKAKAAPRPDDGMTPTERRQRAAKANARDVAAKNDAAIAAAVAAMTEAGERITGPAVAARAGVSLRTAAGRLATMRKAAAEAAKATAETVQNDAAPISEDASTGAAQEAPGGTAAAGDLAAGMPAADLAAAAPASGALDLAAAARARRSAARRAARAPLRLDVLARLGRLAISTPAAGRDRAGSARDRGGGDRGSARGPPPW